MGDLHKQHTLYGHITHWLRPNCDDHSRDIVVSTPHSEVQSLTFVNCIGHTSIGSTRILWQGEASGSQLTFTVATNSGDF